MLLVELTINGVLNRISIDGHGLTHNWIPRIIGFDAPTLSIPSNHGGYARMIFGSISFNPILFSGDWPPPVLCPISIYYTDTTEAARELVFTGTAHLSGFDRESINYTLYGPEYDETVLINSIGSLIVGRKYQIATYVAGDDFVNVGGTNVTGNVFTATGTTPTNWTNWSTLAVSYNGTLNAVISDILLLIPEITTINTTFARAVSPNVTHTITSDIAAIDLASNIAEFYSHLIYIIGTTAYLVDMKLDNGTRVLTEYQFFSMAAYSYNSPVYRAVCGSLHIDSAYAYGSDITVDPYHVSDANILVALTDILAIENASRVSVSVPMIAGNFPKMGEKITIPDTSHVAALASWIRVRKLTYDFLNDTITIEGEGVIAA